MHAIDILAAVNVHIRLAVIVWKDETLRAQLNDLLFGHASTADVFRRLRFGT